MPKGGAQRLRTMERGAGRARAEAAGTGMCGMEEVRQPDGRVARSRAPEKC